MIKYCFIKKDVKMCVYSLQNKNIMVYCYQNKEHSLLLQGERNMKPTIYLDVDDCLIYHPVYTNIINSYYKSNNDEFEINCKEKVLQYVYGVFGELVVDKSFLSKLLEFSDKVNIAIVEDLVTEKHIFDYMDKESIEFLMNSPIKFVTDEQMFCNGIKLTTRCDKLIDSEFGYSILFVLGKHSWNDADEAVNVQNAYIAYTIEEVEEIINFFADNMEFITHA